MKHLAHFLADDMIRGRESPSTSHPGWEMPGGVFVFVFVRLVGLMTPNFLFG
jgi:hypothetical protein